MRRRILGSITLALFAVTAVVACCPWLATYKPAGDVAMRGGLVLGAFWLAWPDLHRLPRWFWYVLPIGFLVLIYARTYLLFLIPLFVTTAFFYMLYRKLWRSS